MSSSDSVSLSTSSSESVESGRSRGRQVDEECTSSGGMVSGIPMETVREVREDPQRSWPRVTGQPRAVTGGWLPMSVINHPYSGGLAY